MTSKWQKYRFAHVRLFRWRQKQQTPMFLFLKKTMVFSLYFTLYVYDHLTFPIYFGFESKYEPH